MCYWLVLFTLALEPRCKVCCKGTVTLQRLSDVECSQHDELSCTVKIDSEFQVLWVWLNMAYSYRVLGLHTCRLTLTVATNNNIM